MSDATPQIDNTSMSMGLLMESVQAQQKGTEVAITRLTQLATGLDDIVRGEIRRALTEELQALGQASQSATIALQRLRRAASVRMTLWIVMIAGSCSVVPVLVAWRLVPPGAQLLELRAERDALAAAVHKLEERGGRIELRTCGTARRLCVRVEHGVPAYGVTADYFVVKGY